MESRGGGGGGGGAEKAHNAPHTMLPLLNGPINKLYNPKHFESGSSASLLKPLTIIILAIVTPVVVNSVKLHFISFNYMIV